MSTDHFYSAKFKDGDPITSRNEFIREAPFHQKSGPI